MDVHDGEKKDVRRPMNAFLIFCKRHRAMVREKNPNLDNRSVTRILGDLWANLPDEEKSQYTDLAKQYKDAFMRANPDYKWHNPDKLLTPVMVTKLGPRPSAFRPGTCSKEDPEMEGNVVSGKLADPSNMGGLSLLLMAGQQSGGKSSQRVTSPPATSTGSLLQLAEMCSTKFDKEGSNQVKTEPECQVLDLTNKKVRHSEFSSQSFSSSHDLNVDSGQDKSEKLAETGVHRQHPLQSELKFDKDTCRPECNVPSETSLGQRSENKVHAAQSSMLNNKVCNWEMKDAEHKAAGDDEDENPIVTYGKNMMDHIIEKLYSSQKDTKPLDKPAWSLMNEGKDLDKTSMTLKNSNNNCSNVPQEKEIKTKEYKSEVQESLLKLPLPLKSSAKEDMLRGENFRSRKRCYSEPCRERYEDHLPPKKLHRMFLGFHEAQAVNKSQGSDTDNWDNEAGVDDEFQPVRKSKRRNRGQRYQELINEGIIQPSKERLAVIKGETTQPCKQEENIIDEEPSTKEELTFDVLSVYPRQIRKRTCSESEKTKTQHDEAKRYKTGDFDLEAHIATLPACSLEKVSRGNKRVTLKPRSNSVSESSALTKRQSQEEAPMEIVLTVPPHLKCTDKTEPSEPVVGSRKRKARKHSVTHLQLLPPEKSKVAEPTKFDSDENIAKITDNENLENMHSDDVVESKANAEQMNESSHQVVNSTDFEGRPDNPSSTCVFIDENQVTTGQSKNQVFVETENPEKRLSYAVKDNENSIEDESSLFSESKIERTTDSSSTSAESQITAKGDNSCKYDSKMVSEVKTGTQDNVVETGSINQTRSVDISSILSEGIVKESDNVTESQDIGNMAAVHSSDSTPVAPSVGEIESKGNEDMAKETIEATPDTSKVLMDTETSQISCSQVRKSTLEKLRKTLKGDNSSGDNNNTESVEKEESVLKGDNSDVNYTCDQTFLSDKDSAACDQLEINAEVCDKLESSDNNNDDAKVHVLSSVTTCSSVNDDSYELEGESKAPILDSTSFQSEVEFGRVPLVTESVCDRLVSSESEESLTDIVQSSQDIVPSPSASVASTAIPVAAVQS